MALSDYPREFPVTAEHLANGTRMDCTRCPVALAAVAAGFPKGFACVQKNALYISRGWDEDGELRFPLNKRTRDKIAAIDRGIWVLPFTARLNKGKALPQEADHA